MIPQVLQRGLLSKVPRVIPEHYQVWEKEKLVDPDPNLEEEIFAPSHGPYFTPLFSSSTMVG